MWGGGSIFRTASNTILHGHGQAFHIIPIFLTTVTIVTTIVTTCYTCFDLRNITQALSLTF